MQVGPLILYSALVGALSGAVVAGFSWLLRTLQGFFMGDVLGYLPPGLVSEGGLNQVFGGPRHWLLVLLLPAVFVLASYLGTGRGLAWLLQAYREGRSIGFIEFIRGIFASLVQLSAGSPLGREGPMVAIGHWLGASVGRRFPLGGAGRYLPFAGIAAGFAAAFHAPVAGALLASEILFRGLVLEVTALAPALIGALAGFTVYGALLGYQPLLELPSVAISWAQLAFGLLIGLLAAGIGTLWLEGSRILGGWIRPVPFPLRHGLLGLALALALVFLPEALGDGLAWVQLGLSPILGLEFLAIAFLARFAILVLAGGVRAYGGYLTPALTMGGLLGLILSLAAPSFAPPVEVTALAGMCALLAGVARAPFAAVVLAGEMGGYSQLPLVLPAVFVAYALTSAQTYPDELPMPLEEPPLPADTLPAGEAPQRADDGLSLVNTPVAEGPRFESALQSVPPPPDPAEPGSPEKPRESIPSDKKPGTA